MTVRRKWNQIINGQNENFVEITFHNCGCVLQQQFLCTHVLSFFCVYLSFFLVMNVAILSPVEWWLCVVPSSLNFLLQLMFLFPFRDSILIFNYDSVIVPVGKHLLEPTHLFICCLRFPVDCIISCWHWIF